MPTYTIHIVVPVDIEDSIAKHCICEVVWKNVLPINFFKN